MNEPQVYGELALPTQLLHNCNNLTNMPNHGMMTQVKRYRGFRLHLVSLFKVQLNSSVWGKVAKTLHYQGKSKPSVTKVNGFGLFVGQTIYIMSQSKVNIKDWYNNRLEHKPTFTV